MTRWIALLGLALTPVAFAQDAPPPVDVQTDVRDAYISGEPLLVRFTVSNPGSTPAQFADLSSRPHLVRFDLVGPDGKKQSWFNTPPETDAGQRWDIVPRGQRKVLLEVPQSQRLAPGRYELTIRILDESGEMALPTEVIELSPADPTAGTLVHDPLGLDRAGQQEAWVHRSRVGYDLYLHHSDGRDATRTIADYHLLELEGPIAPTLSLARPTERWDRHVYWQSGDATLTWVRLDATEAGTPRSVTLPYPRIETIGRGATDAEGGLHMPIWVPGPKGGAGELRVVSVGAEPRFRLVTRLDSAPDWLATEVDSSGNLRMLLEVDGHLDLYTLAAASELPAVGKRLHKNLPDADGALAGPPLLADFGYLDDGDDGGGGLSVFVLFQTDGGLVGRWVGLGGDSQGDFAAMGLPAGAEPIDLLPLSRDDYALLVRSAEGVLTVLSPGELPAVVVQGDAGGLLSTGDQLHVRTLTQGGPYTVHPVP